MRPRCSFALAFFVFGGTLPEAVEACVSSLMADWKSGAKKRPKRYKSGGEWKPIESDDDLRSAAWGICQSSVNAEGGPTEELLLELKEMPFPNPVMVGIAATNRPHITGLDRPTLIERDGERKVKIPFLILGRWMHKSGVLNFTDKFVQKIKDSLHKGLAGIPVIWDARHDPDRGNLADIEDIAQETKDNGDVQVYAIGDPTPEGVRVVEERKFTGASIEFHPDFKNRRLPATAMSFDGEDGEDNALMRLEEVPAGALILESTYQEYLEEEMPEENTNGTPDGTGTVELEQQMETMRLELEQQKKALELAQRQLAESRTFAAEQFVQSILTKAEAHRDDQGRAHHPVFLEWLGKVLREQSIGEGEEIITLEESPEQEDIRAYYRRAAAWLALEMPCSGPAPDRDTNTEPDKDRKVKLSQDEEEPTDEDRKQIRELWGTVGVSSTATVGGG